jgi:hypothetical protein
MRTDELTGTSLPVAVFMDAEAAFGNADGYNLDMTERSISGIHFSVNITMLYQ